MTSTEVNTAEVDSTAKETTATTATVSKDSPVKKSSARKEATGPVRTSGRIRNKIDHFDPYAGINKPRNRVTQEGEGKGVALGELPSFEELFKRYPSDHEFCRSLHRILFGVVGQKTTRKREIRGFKGFVWSKDFTREKAMNRMNAKSLTVPDLKEMTDVLGIEKTGDKEALVNRIVDFLENPNLKEGGAVREVPRKRKAKSKTSSKSKKKTKASGKDKGEKKKRPLTAFFIFSGEMRPKIKKSNPEFSITEISSEIGRRWRELSDAKKKKYQAEAAELKRKFDKENAEQADEEEGDDDEEEEEEEDEDEEEEEKKEKKPSKAKVAKKAKKKVKAKEEKDSQDDEDMEGDEEEKDDEGESNEEEDKEETTGAKDKKDDKEKKDDKKTAVEKKKKK